MQIILKALETLEQETKKEIEQYKDSIKRATQFKGRIQCNRDEYSEKLKYAKDKVPYEAAIECATFYIDKFQSMIDEYERELKAQEEDYTTIVDMIKALQRRRT